MTVVMMPAHDFFSQSATTPGFINGETQGKASNAADRFREDEQCDRLDGCCDNFGIREPEVSVGFVHQNPQTRINFAALHSHRNRVQRLLQIPQRIHQIGHLRHSSYSGNKNRPQNYQKARRTPALRSLKGKLRVASLFETDPVTQNDSSVERQSRLRAVPLDKFSDGPSAFSMHSLFRRKIEAFSSGDFSASLTRSIMKFH